MDDAQTLAELSLPLDSDLETSGSLPGFMSIVRDNIALAPRISSQLFLSPICATLPGSSSSKVGFVSLDAVTLGGKYALAVSSASPNTPAAPAAASVGVASGAALAAGNYEEIDLVNTSANVISLGFGGNAAVLNSGVTLMPNGGAVKISGAQAKLAINAIAGGAASNLAIQTWS